MIETENYNFLKVINKKVILFIRSKYILTITIFIVWILFFDNNNLIERYRMLHQIKLYDKEKGYFLDKIKSDSQKLKELRTDKNNLEKFAREQYLMKKDNEDVFIVDEKN